MITGKVRILHHPAGFEKELCRIVNQNHTRVRSIVFRRTQLPVIHSQNLKNVTDLVYSQSECEEKLGHACIHMSWIEEDFLNLIGKDLKELNK